MKIEVGDEVIVVGKRISLLAGLGSVAKMLAVFWPEYTTAFYEGAFVLTFVLQMVLANFFGITTKDGND